MNVEKILELIDTLHPQKRQAASEALHRIYCGSCWERKGYCKKGCRHYKPKATTGTHR